MAAARFCSECGAPLKAKRNIALPIRSFCLECSPRYHFIRLLLIAAPVLCLALGFAIGHQTRSREPFYFIGTPVDLTSNGVQSSSDTSGDSSVGGKLTLNPHAQLVTSPNAAGTSCGAQTKSGRPCRRRVKAVGYCWQHRGAVSTTK